MKTLEERAYERITSDRPERPDYEKRDKENRENAKNTLFYNQVCISILFSDIAIQIRETKPIKLFDKIIKKINFYLFKIKNGINRKTM